MMRVAKAILDGEAIPAAVSHAYRYIVGMRVDATSYGDVTRRVVAWAQRGESRYICVATVHMVMEAHDSNAYRRIVNGADVVTPDGMPLVWGLRLLGVKEATRVYGPDLTPCLLAAAEQRGLPVGFYGASPRALASLVEVVTQQFPGLRVVYRKSPPFRPATPTEAAATAEEINRSGARILFVALGCPKQERWMAENAGRIQSVMVGVGAAFDFLSGLKPRAPAAMQRCGLEWLFRLCTEPQRLWRRYVKHGPRFVGLFALQLLGRRFEHLIHE